MCFNWMVQQHTATRCNTLQHTATHCNTLQHTATHCNTLQHTATHCNKLQHNGYVCQLEGREKSCTPAGNCHCNQGMYNKAAEFPVFLGMRYEAFAHPTALSIRYVCRVLCPGVHCESDCRQIVVLGVHALHHIADRYNCSTSHPRRRGVRRTFWMPHWICAAMRLLIDLERTRCASFQLCLGLLKIIGLFCRISSLL